MRGFGYRTPGHIDKDRTEASLFELLEGRRRHLLPVARGVKHPEEGSKVLDVYVGIAIHIALAFPYLTHLDTNGEQVLNLNKTVPVEVAMRSAQIAKASGESLGPA